MGALGKKNSKASSFTKWNLTHDDFTCVFSIPVKFEIYFLGLPFNLFFGLISDPVTYYNLWLLKSVQKNVIWLKIF